jgi:hypothetical protein
MAKITARSGLVVDTELLINEPNRTIGLAVAGNLVAKDGASIQAVYSKIVDLWAILSYQDSPFPMNAIDALSGQYQIGIDAGGNANGWTWLNDATRSYLRDGGCEEYNAAGNLVAVGVGITGLGLVSSGSQIYYQTTPTGAPVDFTFTDQVNELIRVYTDTNGDGSADLDTRAFFKAFVREQGKKYKDSVLGDTGQTETGANIVNMLLSNETDTAISAPDSEMGDAPYDDITVSYYTADQTRTIAGVSRNYKKIIDGNNATLEQIYTKIQYLLRSGSDINTAGTAGSVTGKTADLLCVLTGVGATLDTTTGVFIDNVAAADSNRVRFKDEDGTFRENLFTSSGSLGFNSIMVGSGSKYSLMFTTGPGTDDNYGEVDAVTVEDSDGNDIAGEISAISIDFDFDFDNDTLGGTAGTDKPVTLVGVRPNFSKFAVATGTLTRSKAIVLALVAETDRAYL